MIMAAWATFKASRLFKPVLWFFLAFLILLIVFSLGRCTDDNGEAEQAKQTTASSEALSEAAEVAIDKLESRQATDVTIDAAVAATTTEITNANDVDAVRAAVVAGLCNQPAHRGDPACDM